MTAAKKISLISVRDYLEGELESNVKHEYLGGIVYAMAGAKNVHNTIATNWLVTVGSSLRCRPCQAFNSDTKIRLRLGMQTRFYYPDGMVGCRSNPPDDMFQDEPVIVAELVSESTRRTDEGEKKDGYLTLATLTAYLLIETDRPRVVVHRRSADGTFAAELYEGMDEVVPFDDVGVTIGLQALYERVDFNAAERRDEPDENTELR